MSKKFFTLAWSLFFAVIPWSASADVLEEIRETSVLKVGIRIDAVPFGYLDSSGELAGSCLNFINLLRRQVRQELNKEALLVKLYRTSSINRFNLIDDDIAHLECGPNTIREDLPYKVEFSEPFFVTGTQFLIDKENNKRINPNGDLANLTIGVLQGTSTEEIIKNEYPLAQIKPFQGEIGRSGGVQAVQQGEIDAFVSDGILLLGEVAQQGLSLENYTLVPKRPLTCDRYGMILPAGDPQWKSLVDSAIESQRSQQIFANILEEISLVATAETICQ